VFLRGDVALLLNVLAFRALPAKLLGLFVAGLIARITRASVLTAPDQPCVVLGHGLRNGLPSPR
jgi:ABC-type dipeptide/oligopeptide/nickel transport system permease component